MKTYEPDWPLDSWDVVFCEVRCGRLKLGSKVRVWDQEEGGYLVGIVERFFGELSVRSLKQGE